jgi:hypothetical protein
MEKKIEEYKPIGKAIIIVGLAAVAVWAYNTGDGGYGWAVMVFMTWFFWD